MILAPILIAAALAAAETPEERDLGDVNDVRHQLGLAPLTLDGLRELRRRGRETEARNEAARLEAAGLRPIAEVAGEELEIRRASYRDPYMALRMPAVSLMRTRDGKLRVLVTGDSRIRTFEGAAPPDAWSRLAALESAAFAPLPDGPRRKRGDPIPPPPPICHGWSAVLESASRGETHKMYASGCGGEASRPAIQYSVELARIAIQANPDCADRIKTEDPLFQLAECFGRFEPHTTTNP